MNTHRQPPPQRGRGRRRDGERGSAVVTTVVLMITLTGGAIIWLTRDVDRQIAAVSQANAIALQAARSGAQHLTPASLRTPADTVTIDPDSAGRAAAATTNTLLDANHTVGHLASVTVNGDRVTVTVSITEAGRTVTGRATATATAGVTQPGD